MEVWKDIPNYPNYEVSNDGKVRNKKSGRFLKPVLAKGYPRVVLCNDGRNRPKTVHRLVAEAFIDGDYDLQVNHMDGNKLNNNSNNLEWVTPSENILHAYERGLKTAPRPNRRKVRIVETGEEFESAASCARYINGTKSHVCDCIDGVRETHKGYHFEEIL